MLSLKAAVRLTAILQIAGVLNAAEINQPAPAFAGLSNHRGNVVFVNFWASWCAPCRVELPELAKLAAAYKGKKVRVFAINVDHDRARAKALLSQLGLRETAMGFLWDTSARVVKQYDVGAMPTSYIIDERGVIRYIHSGFRPEDPAAWRKEINGLLPAAR